MNKEAIERTKARCKKKIPCTTIIQFNDKPITTRQYIVVCLVVVLIICAAFWSNSAKADIYIKIGSGYKLIETDHIVMQSGEKVYFNTGGNLSARIEIGKESGNWSYGISHHSQWKNGFPFNDKEEPQKTEIFIDYKWTL